MYPRIIITARGLRYCRFSGTDLAILDLTKNKVPLRERYDDKYVTMHHDGLGYELPSTARDWN